MGRCCTLTWYKIKTSRGSRNPLQHSVEGSCMAGLYPFWMTSAYLGLPKEKQPWTAFNKSPGHWPDSSVLHVIVQHPLRRQGSLCTPWLLGWGHWPRNCVNMSQVAKITTEENTKKQTFSHPSHRLERADNGMPGKGKLRLHREPHQPHRQSWLWSGPTTIHSWALGPNWPSRDGIWLLLNIKPKHLRMYPNIPTKHIRTQSEDPPVVTGGWQTTSGWCSLQHTAWCVTADFHSISWKSYT